MPGMKGVEAAEKITNSLKSLNKKKIPIIIASGDPLDEDKKKGIISTLQKPFSMVTLKKTIEKKLFNNK